MVLKRFENPEYREKNRMAQLRDRPKHILASPTRRQILCITTGEVFPSICEAERHYKYGRYALGVSIKRGKPYGGKEWKYL